MPLVACGQLRKLAGEHGKEAVPRRGAEPERRPDHVAGAGRLRRVQEPIERREPIGDSGKNGRHEQSGMDPRRREPRERADARRRRRRAELESTRQAAVERGERDVHRDFVPLGEARQYVQIARDQRRLGDDADGQPPVPQQHAEHLAGEPEPPLGRLVGIGGGADHKGVAAEPRGIEGAGEHLGHAGLDENAALERLPRGERLGGGAAPLHRIAMGVACVAIGAAELAPHVGIERPEPHPGCGRRVEDRARGQLEEPAASLPFVEHRQAARGRRGREEIELPGAHPQRPHPQCRQLTHPEARTSGAAHSGQVRKAASGAESRREGR